MKTTLNSISIVYDFEEIYKAKIKRAMFYGFWCLVLSLFLIISIVRIAISHDYVAVINGSIYILCLFAFACRIDELLSGE